jgi:hypothetical protein
MAMYADAAVIYPSGSGSSAQIGNLRSRVFDLHGFPLD